MGFSPQGVLSPDDAVRYQASAVDVPIGPQVPDGVARAIERLKKLHLLGVVDYEMFTVAHGQALLTLEMALRERVEDAPGHAHRHRGMADLLGCARREGWLRGQRNRVVEAALRKLRNLSAHPRHYQVLSPVDSARSIWDVGEIVNHLWGSQTAGGRLYPEPIERELMAVGWKEDGTSATWLPAAKLPQDADPSYTYVLVLAVPDDSGWSWFDSLYETTAYPMEYIWGPGAPGGADFNEAMRTTGDHITCIDQTFLFYPDDAGAPLLAQRPEVAVSRFPLDSAPWYAVRADFSSDARQHASGWATGTAPCVEPGPCTRCAAESVVSGSLGEVLASLGRDALAAHARKVPDVRVPLHPHR